jgi:hypothetical protein
MSEFSAKYWRNRAAATAAMADRRWIDEKQKFKSSVKNAGDR